MAEVKRLNYFTSQFLVEKDFKDEQAYHIGMRRRLNQALHTWGVADGGLQVTKTGDKVVSVGAGLAMDKDGQEIVFLDSKSVDLSAFAPNADVYLTVAYQEVQDPADHYTSGGVDNYVRTTERPNLQASTTVPAGDGSVIALARVHLDANGNVASIDSTVRKFASSVIDPKSALQVSGLTVNGSLSVTGDTSLAGNVGIKGAVGIGTTPPDRSLTIANTTGANYMNVKDGAREILVGVDATGGILSVMSNHDLVFRAGANNEKMRITAGGNVGIGTAAPQAKLHLEGGCLFINGESTGVIVDAGGLKRIGLMKYPTREAGIWRLSNQDFEIGRVDNSVTALPGSPTSFVTDLYISGTGNVGIGTTGPLDKLNIDPQGAGGITIGNPNTGAGGFTSLQLSISAASGGYSLLQAIKSSGTAWGDIALNPQGGNVGIGTASPAYRLDVKAKGIKLGLEENGGGQLHIVNNPNDNKIFLEAFNTAGNGHAAEFLLTGMNGGNVPQITLLADRTYVSGRLSVAASIAGGETTTGWVLGAGAWGPDNWLRLTTTQSGSTYHDLAVNAFWAGGAKRFDLAEVTAVRADDNLEQGDVVVIDHECGSRVARSTRPGDTSVYGVVSSYDQAAMVIGGYGGPEALKGQTDKVPIALIGRVKVKVSAENGAIHVGDLLTTSATPGHLMRCDDRLRYAGSIAGKALEPLTNGKGTIIALVTLQ